MVGAIKLHEKNDSPNEQCKVDAVDFLLDLGATGAQTIIRS